MTTNEPPSTTNYVRWKDVRDRHLQPGYVNSIGREARLRMEKEQREAAEEKDMDVSFHDGTYAGYGDDGGDTITGGDGGDE